jgi:hypothetical protein
MSSHKSVIAVICLYPSKKGMQGLNGNIYNSFLTSNFQFIIYNITFILTITLYQTLLGI